MVVVIAAWPSMGIYDECVMCMCSAPSGRRQTAPLWGAAGDGRSGTDHPSNALGLSNVQHVDPMANPIWEPLNCLMIVVSRRFYWFSIRFSVPFSRSAFHRFSASLPCYPQKDCSPSFISRSIAHCSFPTVLWLFSFQSDRLESSNSIKYVITIWIYSFYITYLICDWFKDDKIIYIEYRIYSI